MQPVKSKAEILQQRNKLATSYNELLEEFSSPDLRHVGNYTLGRIIGKGSFGKVYLARHNLTNGTKVVLKASSKDDPNLAREIHHHRQFTHPHIARLYEVLVTEKQVWLALEFCQGDELYNYLVKNGPKGLPVDKVQKIFTQLVGAVSYIHSKNCVHRDLKLENVLLDKNENVKLVDFGFTREYEGKANYLQTFCGTICYSAPEMLKGEKYAGEKVDVWSLGIILYALLSGELPFDEDDDQASKQKILKDDPVYPDTFPEQAKALLSKMLSKRPLHRPSLAEVLADSWLGDFATVQQAILKVAQPAPFSTHLEKFTLERMRAAGVDIEKVMENVSSQRCDSLAGWWTLLIEKETKREVRRERRRREKEAEMKILRRLSGASSRLERIAPTLEDVAEEGTKLQGPRQRSTSRGRANRRSTPQILVSDLPRLPEGSAVDSPTSILPPTPLEKDPRRSKSSSRPPLPPKERPRRSSSHLQLMSTNPDLLSVPINGVNKRKFGRLGGSKPDRKFLGQLAALKSWFVESTKRATSPGISRKPNGTSENSSKTGLTDGSPQQKDDNTQNQGHSREVSSTSAQSQNSYGAALTPIASNLSSGSTSRALGAARLDMQRIRQHRNSVSPSPNTPRSSFKRPSAGLRGRKSTSSSVSSVRSIPRYTHSKTSSVSSDSHDASTIHSPGSRSVGRSPHTSIKVLPATPNTASFPSGVRIFRTGSDGATDESSGAGMSVMFAKRRKSPFKGPMLNSSSMVARNDAVGMSSLGSPALFAGRSRESSSGQVNLGMLDAAARRTKRAPQRRSMVITEEEEEPSEEAIVEDDESEIEEVDAFLPVDLQRGESVHSIVFLDDPDPETPTIEEDEHEYIQPDQNVIGDLKQYAEKNMLTNQRTHAINGTIKSPNDSRGPSPRHTVRDNIGNDAAEDLDRTPTNNSSKRKQNAAMSTDT